MISRSPRLTFIMLIAMMMVSLRAQGVADYEQPPIHYSSATPRDAFAALERRITSGELQLAGGEQEALRSLLTALNVPVWSQVLVFSRTSLQRGRIRPERPRALYFSDSVYVGWVPGGLFEVAAIDPVLGPVFYSISLSALQDGLPKVERDTDCLRCHGGTFVRDIPGLFARSVFPDATGEALLRHGTLLVDDQTPFSQRWGGWYVTGYHGAEPHRGNVIAAEANDLLVFEPLAQRPDDLSHFFSTKPYLRATSDVVALLLLEHQMSMQNRLTRAGQAARKMIAYQHGLQTAFKEPVSDEPIYDSVKSVFASAIEEVIDGLLFREAAPLPAGVRGHAELRQAFARNAPRSSAGHALKDLSLTDRLLVRRCSYLIYSDSFQNLPDSLRVRLLNRLGDILVGRATDTRYAYLPQKERREIYAILQETHTEAKQRWTARSPSPVSSAD